MDIKERIKSVIESKGPSYERMRDLFDAGRLCEDKAERRIEQFQSRRMEKSGVEPHITLP